MSKLDKNPIEQVLKSKSTQEAVKAAKNRFRFKPFYEKYKGLKLIANILQYFLPVFSIATGTLFLAGVLGEVVLSQYIAIVLAVCAIVAVEFAKAYALNISFEDWYASSPSYAVFVFSLVLACLSAFVSLQGIQKLHKSIDTSLQDLEANQANQIDSLRKHYDTQIQSIKNKLTEIPLKPTWQRATDEANKELTKTLSTQLTALQQEKTELLKQVSSTHIRQANATAQASGFNLWVVVGIIALVEASILLVNWFLVYYDFMTAKQAEQLAKGRNEVAVRIDDFQEAVLSFLNATGINFNSPTFRPFKPTEIPQETRFIGFKPTDKPIENTENKQAQSGSTGLNASQSTESINTSINTGLNGITERLSLKDKAFLEAYAPVVEDIQKGKTQGEILFKTYQVTNLQTRESLEKKISKSTLQNIKRVLRNL